MNEICYFVFIPSSSLPHFIGLISVVGNLESNPLGHGLGSGGNFDAIFNNKALYDTLNTGSESGIATLAYKMGIFGLILFIAYFYTLSKKLFEVGKLNNDNLSFASSAMVLALLFGTIFQENSLGPQANHLILITAGITFLRDKEVIKC